MAFFQVESALLIGLHNISITESMVVTLFATTTTQLFVSCVVLPSDSSFVLTLINRVINLDRPSSPLLGLRVVRIQSGLLIRVGMVTHLARSPLNRRLSHLPVNYLINQLLPPLNGIIVVVQ